MTDGLSLLMRCLDGSVVCAGVLLVRRNILLSRARDERRRTIRKTMKKEARRFGRLYSQANLLYCALCEQFHQGPLSALEGCPKCFIDGGLMTKREYEKARLKEFLGPAFDVPEVHPGMSLETRITVSRQAQQRKQDVKEVVSALRGQTVRVKPARSKKKQTADALSEPSAPQVAPPRNALQVAPPKVRQVAPPPKLPVFYCAWCREPWGQDMAFGLHLCLKCSGITLIVGGSPKQFVATRDGVEDEVFKAMLRARVDIAQADKEKAQLSMAAAKANKAVAHARLAKATNAPPPPLSLAMNAPPPPLSLAMKHPIRCAARVGSETRTRK